MPAGWLLALASVALSAAAQLMMKTGMDRVRADGADGALPTLAAAATNAWVVGGVACFGLSAVTWLLVLSRLPLSYAYPLVALGIGGVVLGSSLLLGETLGRGQIVGVALIMAGVVATSVRA